MALAAGDIACMQAVARRLLEAAMTTAMVMMIADS